MGRPKGSKNKVVNKTKVYDPVLDNPQVQAVLNNNWMQNGEPNPFFGRALPKGFKVKENKSNAKKDKKSA